MNREGESAIHIWIAEDDAQLREILGSAFRRGGRIVESFEEGRAVMEALQESSCDILVTDLVMPGADGIQILQEVKRLHPESIVIIMTGYASLDTAIQAIRGGAYDYIRKPFKLDELEIVINQACEKISLMRENRSLLERLTETREELRELRETWDYHLTHILGVYGLISDEKKQSHLELILNQINPIPPDYDESKESQEKALNRLERLAQLRKEGFLNEDEFRSLKETLLKKMDLY